jgi:Family of unknown function (DUF5681)
MVDYPVGYGKPPKSSQFVKGKSGNPNGRPKGSQNFASVFFKTMRQRIQVTENGRVRYITKFEAIVVQLSSKALRGDISAIHELRYWMQLLEESLQTISPPLTGRENDKVVLARALERAREAESFPAERGNDSANPDSGQRPE